ncbi:MAG TPA: DUF6448 family protein [Verrucomicrobiae bacterium]|jgi:hypothetical protein|nr:DUF6448 family protein [Verrucomicrobiae bacterium]
MKHLSRILPLFIFMTSVFFPPIKAFAHCDGLDGPVVQAAEKALKSGDVKLVLIWVQKRDEPEIQTAFQKTLTVRKLNPQAQELADRYFFETLVRLHRAGEGASYTGLHPANRDLGLAISAADKALEEGKIEPLSKLLTHAMATGLDERFNETLARKKFSTDDVTAGRKYIKDYVEFVHYVERLYESASNAAEGHYAEGQVPRAHKD